MKKRIAIIGAGISGLIFANLLKGNSKYDFSLYERNSSLNLLEGFGVQLSTNSVSILNKINFMDLKKDNKFYPEKIDFYNLKNNKKICQLDISQFNYKNVSYTTLKRSLLIEFLREKLFTNSIEFNKKIEKIICSNSKIEITFEKGTIDTFDYLVVADGIFSPTKSILFKKNIKPKYFGSLAIRALLKQRDLKFLNKNNISLILGPDIHLVTYPINAQNDINLVALVRKKLSKEILSNEDFFNDKNNIKRFMNESLIKADDEIRNLFNIAENIKCFPTFTSDKIYQYKQKNIFFLGDAFYAPIPSFAQGASQSIESSYELFNSLYEGNEKKYFTTRIRRLKMVNRRSKINYFIFHLSNPIFILIRNRILKMLMNNQIFLNKYLRRIYLKF